MLGKPGSPVELPGTLSQEIKSRSILAFNHLSRDFAYMPWSTVFSSRSYKEIMCFDSSVKDMVVTEDSDVSSKALSLIRTII